MSALENKTVEIIDKSQAAIATLADKLTEMAKQYGPDVADGALQMARIDAANHLLPSLVALFLAPAFYVTARKLNPEDWHQPSLRGLATIGAGLGCAVSTLVSFGIFDLWQWVGIFEPKLWLAKRILGL